MSKKSSSSKAAPPPAAPDPTSEYYREDGVLKSQRVWDPAKKAYSSETFSTPDEQAINKTATAFINQLVGQVPQNFSMSPESLAQYSDAYAAPQRQALNESYNRATGAAQSAASSSGMRNSLGYNRYLANTLERNRAQGLSDIENNRKMMEYQIPSMMLKPYSDAFNLVNAALNGEQAQTMANLEPSFQGSQQASNYALQQHNAQLNNWQLQNAMNKNSGSGFMNMLFGGF